MFVTRLGFNSKAVITGDITQIDLPNANRSGLVEAIDILGRSRAFTSACFDEGDVVRHHLVQRIIRAYDDYKGRNEQLSLTLDIRNGNSPAERTASVQSYSASVEREAALPDLPGAEPPLTPLSSQDRISE